MDHILSRYQQFRTRQLTTIQLSRVYQKFTGLIFAWHQILMKRINLYQHREQSGERRF